MRTLVYFVLGFGLSCGLMCYLPDWAIWAGLGLCALMLAVGTWKKPWRKKALAAVCGCVMGLAWTFVFSAWYLAPPREADREILFLRIRAEDYSAAQTYGSSVQGSLELNGKHYRVKAYLNTEEEVRPGDTVEGLFRLRFTCGGAEEATFHAGEGIFLLVYPKDQTVITPGDSGGLVYFPARLRRALLQGIDRSFPADTAAFARALFLGEDSGLSYRDNTALKRSGIRHMVAVSGMHISILFSLVQLVVGKRRYLTAAVGIPVLLLFAALAGYTPSVIRACTMQGLLLLSLCAQKEYDPPTALAAAALIMLAVNPMVATSVSFQLSVVSMVGIYLFGPPIRERILKSLGGGKGKSLRAKTVRFLALSAATAVGAGALTAPLTAWYFGTVSLLSILTNLLTTWVVTGAFYGIMPVCALSGFWAAGARAAGWAVSWLIRYILWTARLVSSVPLCAIYTESVWTWVWLAAVYGMLAAWLLLKRRGGMYFLWAGTVGLCAVLLLSWIPPRLDGYRLTVLDVGQGQCILLQSNGKSFLVDCGGDRADSTADLAAETLFSQGVFRLDGMILTHYDADHVCAAENLLGRIPVNALYLPAVPDEDGLAERLEKRAEAVVVEENYYLTFGSASLTIFGSDDQENRNESSLCVLFQRENCAILVTGDRTAVGELHLLRTGMIPRLTVLVAGHHGAATSTCQTLLDAASPETVVISVGEDNRYGHPAEQTLERIVSSGCTVRRTDEEGTIRIRG